jgi:large subunit ribosomal protein L2
MSFSFKKNYLISRIKKKLIIGISKRAGRNFFGRKTVFTQSGGVFKKLRVIDFNRVLPYNGVILTIEKDLNRSGFVGLICFENGLYSYILLSEHLNKVGYLIYGFLNKFYFNSSTFLINIPTGNFIHHIELKPAKGAILSRAAGSSSFLISEEGNHVLLKMNSGWLIKISKFCIALMGFVSNINHQVKRVGKAGKNRNLGIRPKVRGIAMNPCDHPHGGGEGRGSPPAAHKTPWGKMTKVPTKRKKKFLLKKKLWKNNDTI